MNTPRLASGLEVVSIPDGIAIVNAGHPVLFHGRAAVEVLVPLIAAMDGTLNASGLAGASGLALPHVERGLQLLAERGLLEDT